METERQIVIARYTVEYPFRIPKGVDLEDKNVVESWCVKWNILHIYYVDGRIKQINPAWDNEPDYKYPQDTSVESAEDMGIMSDDEEENEEMSDDEEENDEMSDDEDTIKN